MHNATPLEKLVTGLVEHRQNVLLDTGTCSLIN